MTLLPLVRIWLWISALATLAGWTLSALRHLNPRGYLIFAASTVVLFLLGRKFLFTRGRAGDGNPAEQLRSHRPGRSFRLKKIRWRFRHCLPFGFAVLAALVFLGGALYPPTNHTALTYRTPRVLQWLAHGHWFWIHTPNYRMNNRACGFEWLSAPLLLFSKSDRVLFLLNFVPFLLLPGLIFSVFTRLGVRPRVAWCWMWLLPTGYTFLLQAGSLGNDTFPTVYALAAVDFACRAWVSRRATDLWLSLLSAALLTGAKASNVPLLLPWFVLFVPLLPLFIRRPIISLGVLLFAAIVSFAPTAILNVAYCGDWSGLNLERAGMNMKNPLVGIWGNALLLILNNLVPPFFPLATWWNHSVLSILPHALVGPLVANFENGFHQLAELPTEDWAGLGFGLSLLLLISCLYRHPLADSNPGDHPDPKFNRLRSVVLISPWIALLVFCMKSGMVTGGRLISPYYPLLLPWLLRRAGHASLVRHRWWRYLALGVILLAFPVIILTPGRPLWPARAILSKMQTLHLAPALVSRALKVYTVYFERSDPLANVRASLPPDLAIVGFMADGDDLDISLWRPFGKKRVDHILLSDSPDQIRQRQIHYVVVGGANLAAHRVSLSDWVQRTQAEVTATNTATLKVNEGPQPWYTVRINE